MIVAEMVAAVAIVTMVEVVQVVQVVAGAVNRWWQQLLQWRQWW